MENTRGLARRTWRSVAGPAGSLLACLFLCSGCSWPNLLITPVGPSSSLEEKVLQKSTAGSNKKIVLIEVEGMLINEKAGGLLQPTENTLSRFVQQLDKAAADEDVAALVLRVNSPGGTVTTSDTMYRAVLKWKEKTRKPVIASAQEMAASGAYYVSCAADRIVVHPTSVVGSVGVIFTVFDLSGTMAMFGLRSQAIKSGSLKDMGSPLHPMSERERQVIQGMIDEYFATFMDVVRKHRLVKETPATRPADYRDPAYTGLFSGRVWTGAKAAELGLADQTGTLDDAIDLARTLSGASDAKVVHYKRPHGYSGSIYAASPGGAQVNVVNVELPPTKSLLPTGFYYLWEP